ncbi:MAG: AbfB domain-containing protein [Dolichospermum sp.]
MKLKANLNFVNFATLIFTTSLVCGGITPAQADDVASFKSYNYPGYYIRHQNGLGELTKISSDLDKKDASFRIIPGLAGDCVSLESVNYPGYFLRHQDSRVKLNPKEDTDLFRKDATFCIYESELDPAGSVSIKSYNYPDRYLRHKNGHLYVEKGSGDLFNKDSTFMQVPAVGN